MVFLFARPRTALPLALLLLAGSGTALADGPQATCAPPTNANPFPEVDPVLSLVSPVGGLAVSALPSPKPSVSPSPDPSPSVQPDDLDVVPGTDVKKLVRVAEHEAIVPRWDSRGRFRGKGDQSKGLCMQAVKDTLAGIGAIPSPGMLPAASAIDAHKKGFLKKLGFKNIIGDGVNSSTAPIGSVLVYSGGSKGYGHIEVRVGESQYCSDFCSARPIDRYANRKLVAVYVKETGMPTDEDIRKIREEEGFVPVTTQSLGPKLPIPSLSKDILPPPKLILPKPAGSSKP